MDSVFKKSYKNAEFEVIVEDDCITTSKIYIDGEMIQMQEYNLEDGSDVPFSKGNLGKIYDSIKADIDAEWERNFNVIQSSLAR